MTTEDVKLSNIHVQEKDDTTAVVFSSQKSQFADYTTWKGIETKTGIQQEDAISFLVKELLDNALDYLETTTSQNNNNSGNNANNTDLQQPEIHVVIEKNHGKHVRIVVSNSNYHHDI